MDWEKIKLGSWSAIGGAALLAVVGFNYGGWVTSGTAAAMAKEFAADALADSLGTICGAQLRKRNQPRVRSPLKCTEAAATSRDEIGQLTLCTRFLMLTRVQLKDSIFR
jgi:hypothetical protein